MCTMPEVPMLLQTISEEAATGRVAEIYERQKAQLGFVMARRNETY
jgi:hypothetical protein